MKYTGPLRLRTKGEVQGTHVNKGRVLLGILQNKMRLGNELQGVYRAIIDDVKYEVVSQNGLNELRINAAENAFNPVRIPDAPDAAKDDHDLDDYRPENDLPSPIRIQILYATYFDLNTIQGGFTQEDTERLYALYRTGLAEVLEDIVESKSEVRFSMLYTGVFTAPDNKYTQPYANYTDDFDLDGIDVELQAEGSLETRYSYGSPNDYWADLIDVLNDDDELRIEGPEQARTTHRYLIYDYGLKYVGFPFEGVMPEFPEMPGIIQEKNIRASYWIPSDAIYGFDGEKLSEYPSEIEDLNTASHRAYAWEMDTSFDINEAVVSIGFSEAEKMIEFIGEDITQDVRSVLASTSVSS